MKRVLSALNNHFEEVIIIIAFLIMAIVMVLTVLFRFVFDIALDWTEELSRYIFIFVVYISSSLAIKQRKHVRVEIIDTILPKKFQRPLTIFLDILWGVFTFAIAIDSIQITRENFSSGMVSPAFGIPMGWIYMMIPVTFFVMGIRIVQQIYLNIINKGENKYGIN